MARTRGFLLLIGLVGALALPTSVHTQTCEDWVTHPKSESLDIWLTKPSKNNCAVTDGTYILKGSVLKLDAYGTAYSTCDRQWPTPSCHVIGTYARDLLDIDAWDNDTPQYNSAAYGKNASGYCAVGVAHEIDTRLYGPTSCGKFASYVADKDRDYTISVEGDITWTPTACDFDPKNTEIETVSFHARCALSRGTPCSGSLEGGGPMDPLNGVGYRHYHGMDPPSSEPNDTWGSCEWIHDLFKVAGEAYDSQYPGEELGYGDISEPGGGYYYPHNCHRNGLEVDMFYESVDGQFVQIDFDVTTGSGAGSGPNSNYDKAKTIALLNALFSYSGRLANSVESVIVDERADITSADLLGNPTVIVDTTPGHHHHFHLLMKDEDGPDSPCY